MSKDKELKYYTYSLDMKVLNILGIVLFIVVSAIVLMIERNDNYNTNTSIVTLFILMFIWLVLHEILHGIAFSLFKSVNKKNITFGMYLEKGVFYCMCKQNIGKKVILTSLLFPFTIIGLITLVIGMIINSYILVFLSILNIVGAIGDIIMTIYFLRCPDDIIYLDLDDCTSFTVLSSKALDNIKVLGINLETSGIYKEDTIRAYDRRRLVISKLSYLYLVIIFILTIISIIK